MSVKCLTQAQKDQIVYWYKQKTYNQKELAKNYNTSERTINRVLIEYGLATPVARIKGEAYQVMQVLKKYNIQSANDLDAQLSTLRFNHAA